MNIKNLSLLLAASAMAALSLNGQVIMPAGITGTGSYTNNANLIINGVVPSEGTAWTNAQNVYWTDPNVMFTIDLGALSTVTDLLVSVDNNDKYIFEYSTNGIGYSSLFTVMANYGEIPVVPGGMDTMSTDALSAEYVAGIDFAPVDARFLRVKAAGQDFLYSIGEVQAIGTLVVPVPEPSTYGLMGAVGAMALVAWRRRKSKA